VGLLQATETLVTDDGIVQAGLPIAEAKVVVQAPNGFEMTATTDQSGSAYFVLTPGGPYVVATGPGVDPAASRFVEVLPNCLNVEVFFLGTPPEDLDRCAAAEKEAQSCWTQDLYEGLSSCKIAYEKMMADCYDNAERNGAADDGGAFEKCKEQTTGLYNNCGQEIYTEVGNCARAIRARVGCSPQ
jgi:hypothetical protein